MFRKLILIGSLTLVSNCAFASNINRPTPPANEGSYSFMGTLYMRGNDHGIIDSSKNLCRKCDNKATAILAGLNAQGLALWNNHNHNAAGIPQPKPMTEPERIHFAGFVYEHNSPLMSQIKLCHYENLGLCRRCDKATKPNFGQNL